MAELYPNPHRRDALSTVFDRRQVRRQFGRAAKTYDGAAVFPRAVADRLIERLDVVRARPASILDAGCGTGYCARALARRYASAQVVGIDLSPVMAAQARRGAGWFARARFIAADAARMPFADGSFDLIASNLMLPWCDPAAVFGEFRRVARADALLVFTSLGPDTLQELRAAWREADDRPHVLNFLDMHDVGDALVHAGFVDPVMDVERYTLTYRDVPALIAELRALGTLNALQARPHGLTGRATFDRFIRTYEAAEEGGRISATCEVVYGHAWVPRTSVGDRRVIRIEPA